MDSYTNAMLQMLMIAVPLLAITLVAGAFWLKNNQLQRSERERAVRAYENLMREKLDVIKTAIAMDYSAVDISALDQRLEKLIGAGQMRSLLDPRSPHAPHDSTAVLNTDLSEEIRHLGPRAAKDSAK